MTRDLQELTVPKTSDFVDHMGTALVARIHRLIDDQSEELAEIQKELEFFQCEEICDDLDPAEEAEGQRLLRKKDCVE